MRASAVLVVMLSVGAACTGGSDGARPTDSPPDPTTTVADSDPSPDSTIAGTDPPPPTAAPTSTTPPPLLDIVPAAPVGRPELQVVDGEEVVFDWTTDRCDDEAIPDIAPRAYRTPDGRVNLTIGHWDAYRMTGPSLSELASDCSVPLLSSDYDPDPAMFNDSEWLAAVYTPDGVTYYGIAHNEYRGDTHAGVRPGQCPSGERLPCLDTSFTHLVSADGGRTFDHIVEPPGHLVATLPYQYRDDTVPSGIRQPSQIVDGRDGFWYLFGNVSDSPTEDQWTCAMRTDDLANPDAWRFWNGRDWTGEFVDPYATPADPDAATCAPYAIDTIGPAMNETVVFDERVGEFLMVGVGFDPVGPEPNWGFYWSSTPDLADEDAWSVRRFLIELPITPTLTSCDDLQYAYPSLIDPDSPSPNFETSDGELFLYLSRFNFGGCSLDRDVVRWPVAWVDDEIPAPDWTFDVDAQGWAADNHLEAITVADGVAVTTSTGDDPWLLAPGLAIPAEFDRLVIRMRLTAGLDVTSDAQLFWLTDTEPDYSEANSTVFDVRVDGVWRDYVIDLASRPGWTGTVVELRLDPLAGEGRRIEIDRIAFVD